MLKRETSPRYTTSNAAHQPEKTGVFFSGKKFSKDKASFYRNVTGIISSQVIDHYENPRNVGALDKDDKSVGTGLVGAPACGDVMKLQVTDQIQCICADIE